MAQGVMAIRMDKQPQPYQAPAFLSNSLGSVVVPVSLSILWVAWMAFRFIRRHKRGFPARRNVLWTLWVVVLPVMIDIGLLWVLLSGIPTLWQLPLSGISVMFPDMFLLIVVGAIAVAGWGVTRTALTLLSARTRPMVQG